MQSTQNLAGQLQPCGISSKSPYTLKTPPSIPQINMSGSSYGSFSGYRPPQGYGNLPGGSPSMSNMYGNVDGYLASNSPRMGNYSPRNIPQIVTSAPQPQSMFNWLFSF